MIQHIKQLFEETKTIILPGLGALTITNPDTGELMFMPYLKHDDGVLTKYIASKEGISEDDAKAKIKVEVERIINEVGTGKSVAFGDFGQFISELGDLAFENKADNKPIESAPDKVATAPTITEPKEKEATKSVEEAKPEVKKKPEDKVTTEKKTPEKEKPVAVSPEKKEDPVSEKEKPAAKETTPNLERTRADQTNESEKNLPEAPKVEKQKVVTPKSVKEKKVEVPIGNKTISEEVKEEKKSAPIPKKEMNILEKEEVAANQKKLDKLRKEKDTKKKKKKRGAGVYILTVFIILLIGGGTYIGLNYDQVKQSIPFLSDKKTPENKGNEEVGKMEELIGEDPTTEQGTPAETDSAETSTLEAKEEPEVTVKPPVVAEAPTEKSKPKPISTSNNQPYHIVAGVFSSPQNAERLAKKISGMGYPSKTFSRGNQTVVSVQSYATQGEAQAALATTKDAAPKGWVLKWDL